MPFHALPRPTRSPFARRSALTLIAFLVCAVSGAFSQSATNTTVQMKGLTPPHVVSGKAKLVQSYNSESKLRLVLGLLRPNQAAEEKFLTELHTKGSPNFMKFLSASEWNKRFSPSVADEQAVVDWATSQGFTITKRYANRLIVDVEAPASIIQQALGVNINTYSIDNKNYFSNDRDPQIPAGMANIIHSISGMNSIQQLRPVSKTVHEPVFPDYASGPVSAPGASAHHDGFKQSKSSTKAHSSTGAPITNFAYDPTDITSSEAYDFNALYNQGHCCNPLGNAGGTPPETSIAIATAGAQQGSDIAGFQAQYPYLAYHYYTSDIDGTPACCDGEGTMDMEWSTAMSNSHGSYQDTSSVVFYDGVNNLISTFTDVYNQILSDNSTRVFTTSWGCEELLCWDSSSMDTDHGIFNSMAGQGWTMVAASGDQGASAGCGDAEAVQYPASDPNIVGAGGTTLTLNSSSIYLSETAWTGGPDGCFSNDGGSTGGYSSYFGTPSYQTPLGLGSRGVPDISLNADWYHTPQNLYFEGSLSGNGGTSIVAPEMAGFFAQANAYMDYVATQNGGCYGATTCSPIGNGNYYLYWFGENPTYAAHYPFYDITTGCNNNDITAEFGLGFYCAFGGWDPVTGWGSINALQLSWAINTYRAGDFGNPVAFFSGPTTSKWYKTNQTVSWGTYDTGSGSLLPTGVAGFSQAWDVDPGNPTSESTPGAGNTFYGGPQYPNALEGCLDLAGSSCAIGSGQGFHTVYVRVWDNSGFSAVYTYGPIGYDSVAPISQATLTGPAKGGIFTGAVKVAISASDASSGVASTVYTLDGGSQTAYTAPFTVTAAGSHSVVFHSTDVAGNIEGNETRAFSIESPTSSTVTSSANPVTYGVNVTFKAKVVQTTGAVPTGTVTFQSNSTVLGTTSLTSGVASFSTHTLDAGTWNILAVYNGSATDIGSTSAALSQTVNKAGSSATVTSSVNPSSYKQGVKLTAAVKSATQGVPSGPVIFMDGATQLGEVPLDGTGHASITTTNLAVGAHQLTVVYNGSRDFSNTTSPKLAQTVKKAAVTNTLTSSKNPSKVGNPVTFVASIKGAFGGAPSGTVSFKDGSTTLGSGAVNTTTHQAKFTTSSLTAGTHHITSVYGGDANFATGTSTALSQVVNP